jgi:hypothetical protein
MRTCKICGDAIMTDVAPGAFDAKLCDECKLLHKSSQRLMNRSPRKAIYYFMDMFMKSRKHTLSEDKLNNCIWDSWWLGQKKQLSG